MAEDLVGGSVVSDGVIVPGKPARGAVVTAEEQEIARDSQIALARQRAKAELARRGNVLLAGLYVDSNATFQNVVGPVAAATEAIEKDGVFAACEHLRRELTGDLATAVQHNFRATAEHVAATVDSFTPSRPLPPRIERVVERRDLSGWERLSGHAYFASDRVLEDGA